jgi:putative restriction endonuclease
MATLTKQQLLQKLVSAATLSGWSVTYDGAAHHPFRLLLSKDDEVESVLVYIWNITSGGRNRPADEYRIQVTGVTTIDQIAGSKTLLLGYWQQNDVFAGWDASHHLGAVSRSPSHQIREEYLIRAMNDGLSICPRDKKDENEVAIAFNPSSFINYVRNLYDLHKAATLEEQNAVARIAQAKGQINEADIASLPLERQIIIRTIAEKQRATDFRRRVLAAYESRCALCGVQLRLVDAAHIIPVKHSSSNDETRNGLCLCALHHRAFDQGLVAVMPDYRIVVNRTKLLGLQMLGLGSGEDAFIANLGTHLRMPVEINQTPHASTIKTALRVRELQHDALEPVPAVTA